LRQLNFCLRLEKGVPVRNAGILLLLAGWILVLSAIMLLHTLPARTSFVLAGMGVEVLGFVLLSRYHLPQGSDRNEG